LFWSLLRRGIIGTFHNVSAKYPPLYVAEFECATTTAILRIFSGKP
jgi:hypothetical protein